MSVVDATRESFRELVAEGVVLVDVWGPDCQPCLALMPHVDKLGEERDDLKVVKLAAAKARRLCIELGVMSLPAYLLFKDGEEVSRMPSGDISAASLDKWLDEELDKIKEVS